MVISWVIHMLIKILHHMVFYLEFLPSNTHQNGDLLWIILIVFYLNSLWYIYFFWTSCFLLVCFEIAEAFNELCDVCNTFSQINFLFPKRNGFWKFRNLHKQNDEHNLLQYVLWWRHLLVKISCSLSSPHLISCWATFAELYVSERTFSFQLKQLK